MSQNGQETIYKMITDKVVAELEKGNCPWHKPWFGGGMPKNLITKKNYRGINVFILSMLGYASPYFLSFKQAKDLGGKIKKGEHGIPVVYWKWLLIDEKQDNGTTKAKKIPFLRYYTVFNVEQTEGIDAKKIPSIPVIQFNPIQDAEKIIKEMQKAPQIQFKEARAFYCPTADHVNMPRKELFNDEESYYATMFHELGHSTGHSSRLARPEIGLSSFTVDHAYSKEELVAEMTCIFLCNHVGLAKTWDNNVAYIQHWLKSLKSDPKMLILAAGKAQKASDYILNIKHEIEEDANKAQTEKSTTSGSIS